ncbi:Chromatin-remodeling complex subunit IES6 [Wickerhamiella sorbophila]|uniref:Chromatin-remodeling complex subunit IES6 n=1 Tax=Wickerhamiella sorbophila TaxID=45607 RepID=A0A2T0FM19_9ASCO|nr:Chromatin-remodeling complex subunit IES6 [Wickerhamiella sorbophila]PRT56034.1 Chromatin-remodeling complex subunit IES6 [Wickerhamiella sorbophila]
MDPAFKTGWKLPKKTRNAKSVLQEEQKRVGSLPPDTPTYFSVEGPPSLLPAKHYCDITGLPAPYKTAGGLRFHNKQVYEIVMSLGPGVDQEYLKLRNANLVLK